MITQEVLKLRTNGNFLPFKHRIGVGGALYLSVDPFYLGSGKHKETSAIIQKLFGGKTPQGLPWASMVATEVILS